MNSKRSVKTTVPTERLTPETVAVRAHDVTVCLTDTLVPDFDLIVRLGMAVRLALHLRGVAAVDYELLKKAAWHLLHIPPYALKPVLELMDEAEFVKLVTQGKTVKTVIPTVPFYEGLFVQLGQVASEEHMSEPEELTLALLDRLARSPLILNSIYSIGADKRLVDHIVDIGRQGGYIIEKRARGRDILVSPIYFSENADKFADLLVAEGAQRISKIVDLMGRHQGWPLYKIENEEAIGDHRLDKDDLRIVRVFAGDGLIAPPAITTTHAGTNHFMFAPRPGEPRLPPGKRPIYEAAMALVAAVRQGQFLPKQYAIRYPVALLTALRDKKYLRSSTEAMEQYRQVAMLRVGRLVDAKGGFCRFELIDRPENIEAVNMAISLVKGEQQGLQPDDEVVMALRSGDTYVESLIGRKQLVREQHQLSLPLDEQTQQAVDDFLLGVTV